MINFGTLTQDVATPHGIYPAGLRVVVRKAGRAAVQLCLDPDGAHLAGGCHIATVAADWVTGHEITTSTVRRKSMSV